MPVLVGTGPIPHGASGKPEGVKEMTNDAMINCKDVDVKNGYPIAVAEMRKWHFFPPRYGDYYYLVFVKTIGPEIRIEKQDFETTRKNIQNAIMELKK
jgi:hypothetical protein